METGACEESDTLYHWCLSCSVTPFGLLRPLDRSVFGDKGFSDLSPVFKLLLILVV